MQEGASKAFQEVIISSPEGKQHVDTLEHAPTLSTKTLFIHASDLFLALQSQTCFQKYYFLNLFSVGKNIKKKA